MIQTPALTFQQVTTEFRQQIDEALRRYIFDLPDDCPARLREAMGYSLLSPCKRLRPTLVLMAAEVCGGAASLIIPAAIPAACAVEMIHTYSLIHDDLPAMDDDDLRRGRPSCHKQFDEALAILAGDGLLTLAFEILARDLAPASVAAGCCAALASAAGPIGMVGGQTDDLDQPSGGGDLDRLQSIHRRKTGALIHASLRLGAIVAGADDTQLTALDTYGTNLGLAFQITDDLLDVSGDEKEMGKRTGKDREHGKLTYPALLGVEASRRKAEKLIEDAIAALRPLAAPADGLVAVARFVTERKQ